MGNDAVSRLAAESLLLEGLLVALALGFTAFARRPFAERLWLLPTRLSMRASFVLLGGTVCLSFALDGLVEMLGFGGDGSLAAFEALLAGTRGATLVLALAAFALAPGIAEEILFRGWLQHGLMARVGPGWAIGLSSLAFGAVHVDPVHAVAAAVLGVYLGTIAYLAWGIRASIAAHIGNNVLAIGSAAIGFEPRTGPLSVLVGLGLAVFALVWVARRGPTRHSPSDRMHGLQNLDGSVDP